MNRFLTLLFLLRNDRAQLLGAEVDFSHDIAPTAQKALRTSAIRSSQKKEALAQFPRVPLAGGESGAAVVVGKSSDSELMARIKATDQVAADAA